MKGASSTPAKDIFDTSMTACEPSDGESWWVGARSIKLALHLLDSEFLREEAATFWNHYKHSS